MRTFACTVISIVLSLASVLSASAVEPLIAPRATGKFEFGGVEFGQSHPFAKVHATVMARNLSDESVDVERIIPREPTGVDLEFEQGPVRPGETRAIKVDIALAETVGRVGYYFDIYVKGQTEPVDGFVVRGFADWIVSPASTNIEFGTFDVNAGVRTVVPIETRPGTVARLVGVEKPSAYFDAKIVRDGSALELRSKSDSPWSSFDELLIVQTDNALQRKVAFRLRGQARGLVVPSADPLDFGLIREGHEAELILVLSDTTGKPLEVGKIVAKSVAVVSTSVSECAPQKKSCKYLKVAYPPMSMKGSTGGLLEIELPAYKKNLVVRFGAIGIGKDTQIRDLAADFKAAQDEPKPISTILQSSVAQSPASKAQPAQMQTPAGNGPLLKWQVANEFGIYGYEIYRALAEDGPFARVNTSILERLEGDPEAGSIYQWRDSSAESGVTYWYYINIVYTKGQKQQFTSPQKVVAK